MTILYKPRASALFPSPIDMTRCRASVYDLNGFGTHQCNRKKSIEVDGIGYCKQHNPVKVAERQAEAKARNDARWEREAAPFYIVKAYGDVLRQIADGHNDPRQIAAEVLAKFKEKNDG